MAPYRARRRIRNPRRATTTSTTATATTTTTTTTTDDDDDGDHSNNKNQESPQYSTTTSEGLSKNDIDGRDFDALEEEDLAATTTPSGCCSTPKAKRFRIPKISTCPPAPRKKQRLLPSNFCSLRRSKPIAFFAPPDLELFFFFAVPDIAV